MSIASKLYLIIGLIVAIGYGLYRAVKKKEKTEAKERKKEE